MFGKKLKSSILALALAVPLLGEAQAPPGPPQGPDGPQGPPAWRRGPDQGPGFGRRGRMGGGGMMRGRGMRHGRGMGPGGHMRGRGLGIMLRSPAMRERLGFTAEQATRIQAQDSAFAKARIQNDANLRVKRMELGELIAAEKPDRAAIDRKLREVQEAQTTASKSAIDHRLAIREMITPEQRQKMQEMFREHQMGPREMEPPRGPGLGPRGPRPPAEGNRPPAPPPGTER